MRNGQDTWPGRAFQRVKDGTNMTDRLGALTALLAARSPLATPALQRFHADHRSEPLAIDKWFRVQASAPEALGEHGGSVLARARELLKHPDFSLRNPNRVRSLVVALCRDNPAAFHRPDAAGYVFWADQLLAIDAINPQLAARLARVMDRWSTLTEPCRSAAHEALARVVARGDLSTDTREIVTRALEAR